MSDNRNVEDGYPSGVGGGIWNSTYGGDLTITNSTVSGNTSRSGGGIVHHGDSYPYGDSTLTNSTVSGNTAIYYGEGILNYGLLTLADTIVADNGTTAPNCNGAVNSLGYNLADDGSCGFTGPGDLVFADAMLGPLTDNGGPTETHALLAGSPAIDAGSPACPPPGTDQRVGPRPQGAACDIGACEFGATPPGAADCLCEVTNINPNQVVLQNVGTGGKGLDATRKMVVIVEAVDAPGATCDPGEFSNPTPINLKMEDDGGNIFIDSAKTIVCEQGVPLNLKRNVFFQGPSNCADGEVPPPKPDFSLGTITAMGSAPGTADYVEGIKIKCFE